MPLPIRQLAILRSLCVATAFALLMATSSVAQQAADETLRLRVYWGGGEPQSWSGRFAVEGGQLSELQPLSVGPRVAATQILDDGAVQLRKTTKATHNAFDVTLAIGEATLLEIDLSPDGADPQRFKLALETLRNGPYSATLDGSAGRLVVQRVQADQLRIDTGRDQLILSPGETLPLNISAAPIGAAPMSPLDLTIEVRRGRSGPVATSDTRRIEVPATGPATQTTDVTLPVEEGVYTIRVAAVRPPGLTTRFLPRAGGRVLVERSFQVVVFDPTSRRRLGDTPSLLAEIDPTTPRWWERVPRWVWPRRLPRPEQHLGSSPPRVVTGVASGKLVELAAVDETDESTGGPWQAYQLPVAAAGRPHLVEVDYPVDQPQTLTLSLLDRDATGRTTPLGAAESVFVDDWALEGGSMRTVRRLFWPRSEAPLLLLSNHQTSPARFGKVRVYELREETAPAAAEPPPLSAERLVNLCVTTPRPADAFGATLRVASDGAFVVDDWQTWYETSTRLADMVEQGGYNGAVVTVASSRGVVYPSSVFPNVPGADRQPLAGSTTDLPRKDLLELLLREFDRRGLRLTPAIAFDTALLPIAASGSVNGSDEPIHNPLDRLTAEAMRRAVAELVARCAGHPSFAGVAIDVGDAADYAVLPEDAKTPSNAQLEQFLAESRLAWPDGVPRNPETIQIALSDPWRKPWATWRADRMAELQRSLLDRVTEARPDAQLLMLTHQLADHPMLRRVATPSLDSDATLANLLSTLGLPLEKTAPSQVTVLPQEVVGGRRLATDAIGHRLNALVEQADAPRSGLLVLRRPRNRRLASPPLNDRLTSPLPVLSSLNTPSRAAALLAKAAQENRSTVLLDGGEAVSLLIDPEAVALRRELTRLPAVKDENAWQVAASSPLLVRSRSADNDTLIEIANSLPWPIEVSLTVEAEHGCTGYWTGEEPFRVEQGQPVLARTAPPHSVSTCRFADAAVRVTGVVSKTDPRARQELAARLQDLKRRDLNPTSRYEAAENLSFEQLNDRQQLAGWEAVVRGGALQLTDREPQHGEVALLIENPADAIATLQTRPLPAPATGQLAVTFHLRPEGIRDDTQVVVRIEEVNGDYVSSTTLDAEQLGGATLRQPDAPSAEAGWRRPYAFAASDLPIGGDKPIRVVFEFRGEGRIAIDDLALYDLVFPLDLGPQSTRQKLALLKIIREAESALERDDLAACYRTLNGYWPHFLREHTPLLPETPPEAIAETETPVAEEETTEQEPAEVSSGWRSYLPRFWR